MEKIINNIDLSKLDDNIQDAILRCFSSLQLKEKLIIFAKIHHGNMFKVSSNDLFNMHKTTVSTVYNEFIEDIKYELNV